MRFRAAGIAAIILSMPFIALSSAQALAYAERPKAPEVDVVEVSGIIDSPTAEYLADEIRTANKRKAALLVISISSRGGLNIRTDSLLQLIHTSRTPIAVYIGPQRAQAGGSAAVLAAAAHITAIGPSGRLGPAHPTNLAVDPDSPRGKALRSATRLQILELQALRRRIGNPDEILSRSIPASQALAGRHVDYTVVGVHELLQRADGKTVTTAAGDITLRLSKDEVDIRFHKPGPWRRLLHALINPTLVYVLLVAGILLIVFEIFQPGFGVAGVTGALLLVGGAYGLIALPTALWAVVLFLAGSVLMSVDVAVDGLGPPTFAGIAGFAAGSLWMFSAPAGELRMAWWLALLGTLTAFIFFVPVMTVVRRARQPIRTVPDPALIGQTGQVRSMLNPEGYVWVGDSLWRATSEQDERIRVGEDVTITGVDGPLLTVRRA